MQAPRPMSRTSRRAVAWAGVLAAAIALGPWPAAAEEAPPSNKNRPGTYQVKTSHAGCNYYVCVPPSYSPDNPAGIHLFFHGQGGGGSAPNFGQWSKYFLEPYNLIGINMQYEDGDNAKDTGGKVEAAEEALRQVAADYKIVFGRGAAGCFSGGALPQQRLFEQYKAHAAGGPAPCPFNHASLYGSNYRGGLTRLPPMTWFIGLGSEEWNLANLGETQTDRAAELLAAALKGGCPDAYLKITKGKGHAVSDEDVRDSAAGFRRSDLLLAPFLCEADYPEAALAPIVKQANAQALGKAAAAVARAAAGAKDAALKAKAEAIGKRIEARVDAILALARELADTDPVLCGYYGTLWARGLAAHPKAKDLKALLAEAEKRPNRKAALAAYGQFCTTFKHMFQSNTLNPEAAAFLEDARAKAGEKSLLGKMAAEFLLLR